MNDMMTKGPTLRTALDGEKDSVDVMPDHHVQDEILMDYAAGTGSMAQSIFVAAHLTLCPTCRNKVAEFERVGGAVLDAAPPVEVDAGLFEKVMAGIEDSSATQPANQSADSDRPREAGAIDADDAAWLIPAAIRAHLPAPKDELRWQPVVKGIEEITLPLNNEDTALKARLMRIKAGTRMPKHTHGGLEMTMVLQGSFIDEGEEYARGDVTIHDDAVDHQPVAGTGESCICFVVTDAPLRLTGRLTRFLNPFVKF